MYMPPSPSFPTSGAPSQDHPPPLPRRSLPASTPTSPTPTVSDVLIIPTPTAVPDPPSDLVLISLNTEVTIGRYHHYYHVPVQSFRPTYYALDDGTLLTDVYYSGLVEAKAMTFIVGLLVAFFLRNTIISASYLSRSKVKDKTLFYLLVASQFSALMAAVVHAVGIMSDSVNCTIIGASQLALFKVSCDLMITGILGLKAYRCLSNSIVVLVFLGAVCVVMLVLLGLDIAAYEGVRSMYGSCEGNKSSPRYLEAMVLTAFIETAFLCGCFLFAIWNSHRVRTQTRLSLGMSDENGAGSPPDDVKESIEHAPRGWWDYVPEAQSNAPVGEKELSLTRALEAFYHRMRSLWSKDQFPPSVAYARKPSLPGPFPIPQPARAQTSGSHRAPGSSDPHASMSSSENSRRALRPPCQTSLNDIRGWFSRFSRVHVLRQVLRNELLYTTFLAAIFLFLAIFMFAGIRTDFLLATEGWLIIDWFCIAIFTMHSFNRVVHRQELEAVLQHPSAWDRMLRTEGDYDRVFFEKRFRRSKSPRAAPGTASHRSHRRVRHRESAQDDDGESVGTTYERSFDEVVSSYRSSRKPSAASSLPPFPMYPPPSPLDSGSGCRSRTICDSAIALPSLSSIPMTGDFSSFTFGGVGLETDAPSSDPPAVQVDSRMPHDTSILISHSIGGRTHLRTSSSHESPDPDSDGRASPDIN